MIRLAAAQQWSIYLLTGLLTLSGVLWLWFHHFVRLPGEFGPQIHPLEPWWLKVHGVSAAAFLVAFGSVLPLHVRSAWRNRRNRVSGTIFLSVTVLLASSGLGLYYAGGEGARDLISVLHWSVGLAMPALAVWHVWRGRTWMQGQRADAGRDGAAASAGSGLLR